MTGFQKSKAINCNKNATVIAVAFLQNILDFKYGT